MTILNSILAGIICLFVGGGFVYILIKRFNKKQIEASTIIEVSKEEDNKRDKIVNEIDKQIEENKRILNEVKDTLNNSD